MIRAGRRSARRGAGAAPAAAAADGGGGGSDDATAHVPSGIQAAVRAAQDPRAAEFPDPAGKSLQQLADSIGGGPQMGMASSVFVAGRKNRVAFGMIDKDAGFLYGKTALYIAPTPGAKARGPFVAPADVLITKPAYRSQQAATEGDPFAAVYAAQVPLPRPGSYTAAGGDAGRRQAGRRAAGDQGDRRRQGPHPGGRPGRRRRCRPTPSPRRAATSRPSTPGARRATCTTSPSPTWSATKPVALLFATPQLCQSRVCGPVVDIALQLKARYGDRIEFIHQEVYVDNDVKKGLRPPLKAFHLPTEPWLFVVDKDGRITARLEGSFGQRAFEQALNTAL